MNLDLDPDAGVDMGVDRILNSILNSIGNLDVSTRLILLVRSTLDPSEAAAPRPHDSRSVFS